MSRSVYKYEIRLKGQEKRALRQAKKNGQRPARLVTRILIVLWAAQGRTIAKSAELLACSAGTGLNWRKWFLARRAGGALAARPDRPRAGRLPLYDAQQRAQIVAGVCEILQEHDRPLSRLAVTDLHRQLIQEPALAHLSQGSLARMLTQNALKPWQYRYWLFPRDPDFARKAGVVLEL